MPNMVYGRTGLALVAVRDKLFAIGGNFQATAEVYDGNKFSQLKYSDLLHDRLNWINNAVAIGSRIFISKTNYVGAQLGAEYSKKMLCFDTEKARWYEIPIEIPQSVKWFICLKVPCV